MKQLKGYLMFVAFCLTFLSAAPKSAVAAENEAYFYCIVKDAGNQMTYYSSVFGYRPQGTWDHSLIDGFGRKFNSYLKSQYSFSSYVTSPNCYLKNDRESAKEEFDDEIAKDDYKVVRTGWRP